MSQYSNSLLSRAGFLQLNKPASEHPSIWNAQVLIPSIILILVIDSVWDRVNEADNMIQSFQTKPNETNASTTNFRLWLPYCQDVQKCKNGCIKCDCIKRFGEKMCEAKRTKCEKDMSCDNE